MKLFEAIKRLFSRWFGRKQQTPVQYEYKSPFADRPRPAVKPVKVSRYYVPGRNKNRIPDDCFRFLNQAAKTR